MLTYEFCKKLRPIFSIEGFVCLLNIKQKNHQKEKKYFQLIFAQQITIRLFAYPQDPIYFFDLSIKFYIKSSPKTINAQYVT
jgi:hypothetical protein